MKLFHYIYDFIPISTWHKKKEYVKITVIQTKINKVKLKQYMQFTRGESTQRLEIKE